ncbi:MAG: hypothetical protein ACPLY7_00700 [Microgenomates group bacterium]
MEGERKDFFQLLLTAFLLLFSAVLFLQKINLTTADLGRHIKNGELILQGIALEKVLGTNLYSYTYPDFPFLNHHWGSGVIFYLVHQFFGFAGISAFFLIISLVTLSLFFSVAVRKSNFSTAFLVAVVLLPLMANRTEIRPEAFSYLFCGIFWWILDKASRSDQERESWQGLVVLPILETFWVNLHIYFFLGFVLTGVFMIEKIIKKEYKAGRNLLLTLFLCVLASLLNPAGLRGVLYPLQIFGNYGYRVLENQSVWFLDKIIKYPASLYFKIDFGLLLLSWLIVLLRRKNFSFSNLIFSVFISYLGWTAVRNFALFGLFSLPIISSNLSDFGLPRRRLGKPKEVEEVSKYFAISSLAVLIIFVLFLINIPFWQTKSSVGFGLKEGVEKGAEFFQRQHLQGPIFNNYDNGSYLIYFLYPQERVFVDNRPEAYPKDFFEKIYIPMQENEEVWKQMEKKYNFNVIFFYRLDLTPWAQTFLINRVSDPSWSPVYVDDYSIIFAKRNEKNKEVIKKFELPKGIFTVRE